MVLGSRAAETIKTMAEMAVYGLTIFIGAFLLFQVQPLIGKYILPWFGGAPSVWTICMLFFQVMLLAGYAYAHAVSTWFKPRLQGMAHLGLTILALCFVPAIPSETWKPNGVGDPTWRIIGLLGTTIGLPYLVLAATSPLLQHWFSRTSVGRSPYRLYALSNAGSLLALASYPTWFETHFTRQMQARIWAGMLVAYAIGLAGCVWRLRAKKFPDPRGSETDPSTHPFSSAAKRETVADRLGKRESSNVRQRFAVRSIYWLMLPACASALLLATTNKMCQEVAVVPFLWVVPLGLYLLSFIISFDSPRWYRRIPFGISLAVAMGAVCWSLFHWSTISVPAQMAVYGGAFFVCCMVCHGELYRLKPEPERLTRFYLMIALGGALGGVLVAIVSPVVFNDYYELQWGLALCCLLFLLLIGRSWRSYESKIDPSPQSSPLRRGEGEAPGAAFSAAPLVGPNRSQRNKSGPPVWVLPAYPVLVFAWVGMVVSFFVQAKQQSGITVSKTRNFYGVLTVYDRDDPGSSLHFAKLVHGRTVHGLQFKEPVRASWPTLYFGERSGVGLALQQLAAGPRRIGIVGLGIGTLATYGRTGDYFRLYEINPTVARLAKDRFSYLAHSQARTDVVLGDARLSLEREPPQGFDLLVLDAFTSDAIPVHLLTEQAFRIYERHLKRSGILAVHVSNLSLDLEPVVANAASTLGYEATMVDYRPPPEKWWVSRSKWMLLAKGDTALHLSRCCRDARTARTDLARVPLWTDDFTSLFQILWRRSAGEIVPNTAEQELNLALQLAEHGDASDAAKHYRVVLENEPDSLIALNNLAWILATNPDPSVRNGTAAIIYARQACELTNFRTTLAVGTLAAAYAEGGQFSEAVATAEKACHLASEAHDAKLLQRNQQLLELYRAGKPVRE